MDVSGKTCAMDGCNTHPNYGHPGEVLENFYVGMIPGGLIDCVCSRKYRCAALSFCVSFISSFPFFFFFACTCWVFVLT